MREQVDAQFIFFRREVEGEVRVRLHVAGFVAGDGAILAVAFDLDRVARGINGLERAFAFQLDPHAHALDRLGGKLRGVERQGVAHQTVVRLEQLGVSEGDALFAVRLDGEDADSEHVAVGVFEKRRVTEFAHDVLINAARLVSGQQLGSNLPAVNFHRELLQVRAFRDGEHKRAFQPLWVRIVKFLFDPRDRNLVGDAHRGFGGIHFERREDIRARPRNRSRRQDGIGRNRAGPQLRVIHDDQTRRARLRNRSHRTIEREQSRKEKKSVSCGVGRRTVGNAPVEFEPCSTSPAQVERRSEQ